MKNIKVLLVALLAVMFITSCTRSAAISLEGTNTPAKSGTATQNQVKSLNALELAGTQTAVAKGTTSASMPTLAVTGTPGTKTAASADFPTPTGITGGSTTVAQAQGSGTATSAVQAQNPTEVPTSAAAATSAPASNPGTYVLQEGDYPYCLARRFDVNPIDLLEMNGISESQTQFKAGTVIQIPQNGNTFPGLRSINPHPDRWTVDPGDTIYSIACWYGDVNPLSIAAVNGLTGDYALTVGSVLQIP